MQTSSDWRGSQKSFSFAPGREFVPGTSFHSFTSAFSEEEQSSAYKAPREENPDTARRYRASEQAKQELRHFRIMTSNQGTVPIPNREPQEYSRNIME